MPGDIDLSVVVLCYRSGEAIRSFAKKIEETTAKLSGRYEIIYVGNYMPETDDRTEIILQELVRGHPHCKALCKPKRGMMGWDMRSGLEAASGNYLCVIDGDGQFPIESIEQCYTAIRQGTYDLVKTYRVKRNDGLYRSLISKIYNMLFSALFPGLNSRDINAKPKIMTRKAYEAMRLTSDDWFIDAEIMLNIREHGMAFCEFPIEFLALSGRASFVNMRSILEFMMNMASYRIREYKRNKDGR